MHADGRAMKTDLRIMSVVTASIRRHNGIIWIWVSGFVLCHETAAMLWSDIRGQITSLGREEGEGIWLTSLATMVTDGFST
jgi:hypothetical protein